jgi:hypothetical protein
MQTLQATCLNYLVLLGLIILVVFSEKDTCEAPRAVFFSHLLFHPSYDQIFSSAHYSLGRIRVPAESRNFTSLCHPDRLYGAHSASYPMVQ